VSRISGWAAHVIEQLDDNRLSVLAPSMLARSIRSRMCPWTGDNSAGSLIDPVEQAFRPAKKRQERNQASAPEVVGLSG